MAMSMDNPLMLMSAQDPVSRKQAFRPAEPPTEQATASIRFLRRVTSVEIVSGDKKTFEVAVQVRADPDNAEFRACSFSITRTADHVERLQRLAVSVCAQHLDMSAYNLPTCALCEQFKTPVSLPFGATGRLLNSKEKIHKRVEGRIVSFVRGAVVPPTNAELHCEGIVRLPEAVANFLLYGVDQTKL